MRMRLSWGVWRRRSRWVAGWTKMRRRRRGVAETLVAVVVEEQALVVCLIVVGMEACPFSFSASLSGDPL